MSSNFAGYTTNTGQEFTGEFDIEGAVGPIGPPGPQGPQGETGPQGPAPEKGVDYFTAEEKKEMTDEVEDSVRDEFEDIEETTKTYRDEVVNTANSRMFINFYVDVATGGLYAINASTLRNLIFTLKEDGGLYVTITDGR